MSALSEFRKDFEHFGVAQVFATKDAKVDVAVI